MRRLIFACVVLCGLISGNLHAADETKSLIGQDSVALPSRAELAHMLYTEGERVERCGDLAGAVRLWAGACALHNEDEIICARFRNGRRILIRSTELKYQSALIDVKYGRVERAKGGLNTAHSMIDGIEPELSRRIEFAIMDVKKKEN